MLKSISKKFAILTGLVFLIYNNGYANEHFYFSAYESFNTFQDKSGFEYRPNIGVGVALGDRVLPNLRTEIECSYRAFEGTEIYYCSDRFSFWDSKPIREVASIKTSRFDVFGNIIYDLIFRENFTPYVGGGLGYEFYRSKLENSREYIDREWGRGPAVQWITGFRMPFHKTSKFNLEYRFLSNTVASRSHMFIGKFSHHF